MPWMLGGLGGLNLDKICGEDQVERRGYLLSCRVGGCGGLSLVGAVVGLDGICPHGSVQAGRDVPGQPALLCKRVAGRYP